MGSLEPAAHSRSRGSPQRSWHCRTELLVLATPPAFVRCRRKVGPMMRTDRGERFQRIISDYLE